MGAAFSKRVTKKSIAFILVALFALGVISLFAISEARAIPSDMNPQRLLKHTVEGAGAADAPPVTYRVDMAQWSSYSPYRRLYSVMNASGDIVTTPAHFELKSGEAQFHEGGYFEVESDSIFDLHLSHGEELWVNFGTGLAAPEDIFHFDEMFDLRAFPPVEPFVAASMTAEVHSEQHFYYGVQISASATSEEGWDSSANDLYSDYGLGISDGILSFKHTRGRYSGPQMTTMEFVWQLEDVPNFDLTKTLRAPAGTTLPQSSFSFEFSPVQVELADTPTLINSRPQNEVPVIAPNPIVALDMASLNTDSTTKITTATGSIDLFEKLKDMDFPGGGVYAWNLREISGSSGIANMSYDSSRFQVRAYVNRFGELVSLEILELNQVEGEWLAGPKVSALNFVNDFRTTSNLEVSKLIPNTDNNEFANLDTPFSFTLTLTEHALAPLDFPFAAQVVDSVTGQAVNPPRNLNIAGMTTNFDLSHGETLRIPSLPTGTSFNVTEAAHALFVPSVSVALGGSVVHEADGTRNTALASGNHLVVDSGRNAADFENNTSSVPTTGMLVQSAPWALSVLAVLAFVLLATVRQRKRIENLDLV